MSVDNKKRSIKSRYRCDTPCFKLNGPLTICVVCTQYAHELLNEFQSYCSLAIIAKRMADNNVKFFFFNIMSAFAGVRAKWGLAGGCHLR